ncbi:antibiotic biosynthesis monooxygenase [Pseudomonas gingeri]|uniref:Antibiotic biosynthesis monooxygenase n=1 Tax=Pseudomonas gingeri TaxID=117681 RepID=A0A7Y8C648_9PSED|nr:antibiotic biosynthesis monooxygenase [Pseudomonas gingeri]NWA28038.1 antibiotic biosynthesis monooxygenase [Pseudomonas gingeri]NWB99962.1 antibiotic biosynthesis monooxygenase [Pseudomonas gingeri]NWD70111.1 antibiotic biosynthesis monooxygenase [Pseudomonas gingeri]NWD75452.1 antibiotic biosynthesis monooxygenase [Pseudomonas gingeri]
MPSTEQNRSFTQLIQFEIEPGQLEALVAALARQTERLARIEGGFISGTVQASDDGRRVLNTLQWRSRAEGEVACARFDTGEEDFWALIRAHRAKAVTFGSFQVLRSIERSQDDALQCALVG